MKAKKFLTFILAAVLISSLLSLFAAADGEKLEISEDYMKVTYGGKEYVRFDEYYNLGSAEVTESLSSNRDFALTAEQDREIHRISGDVYGDGDYLFLGIDFYKGGWLSAYYVSAELLDTYESFKENGGSVYFSYYYDSIEGNQEIKLGRDEIFKAPVTKKSYELNYYASFSTVYTSSADGLFEIQCGEIIHDTESNTYYFYFELADNGGDTVTLYELDRELFPTKAELPSDDSGAATVLKLISAAVVSLFLGVVPLAALIFSVILAIKAKKPYRNGLIITALLFGVELVTFAVTIIIMLLA